MSIAASKYPRSAARPARPVILIAAALVAAGCAAHPNTPVPADVTPFGRNVTLIYLPGVGGYRQEDRTWVNGLKAGGYEGKTEAWDWTGKLKPLSALRAHGRQRAEARRIADRIRELRSESPADALVLVGHSAGAGLVVMALEDLPPDVQVNHVVLLAPALSRTYDLTRALRRVRGQADVFYSKRDTIVLALGTVLFGTVDGVHGEAAGHGGFVKPPGASEAAYARLVLYPYSHDRRLHGDDGGHDGVLSSGLAAGLVAPLLRGHELDHGPVARIDAH